MFAIRVEKTGEPEVMQYVAVPDLIPADDQILIEIKAAGVNPVDTYLRAGGQGYAPQLPYTPGIDGAGVILSCGAHVEHFHCGQRVYLAGSLTGTYAQQALCTPQQVFPLPEILTFEQGAGIHVPYATAYRALFQIARAKPGESLLIHGATGGVGLAATQWAIASGLTVYATTSSETGRKILQQQGVQHIFNHHEPEHIQKILSATKQEGVDVILEMLANKNLNDDLQLLARKGRVVIIGNRGTIEINPRATMAKDLSILGMSLMSISDVDRHEAFAAINAGLASELLKPFIQQKLPLSYAAQAHREILRGGICGKIILSTS